MKTSISLDRYELGMLIAALIKATRHDQKGRAYRDLLALLAEADGALARMEAPPGAQ